MRHFLKSLAGVFALQATLLGVEESKRENELHAPYAALLESYTDESGVSYDAWFASEADRTALKTYVKALGAAYEQDWSREATIALLTNLYNAAMIDAVFAHYPIQSVTDILPDFGVFKAKNIQLGDKMVSLDDVEKGILLKEYKDPRIHFAVNCASISCPPLRSEPFYGHRLEEQFEEQTQWFANWEAEGIRVEKKTLYLSSLLDWYASDFPDSDPIAYLAPYREQKIPKKAKVAYIPYDWGLNKAE